MEVILLDKMKRVTPLKAIRKKCLDCSCFSPKEVRECPCTDCSLYSFRFGHNPARKGKGNVKNINKNSHPINNF